MERTERHCRNPILGPNTVENIPLRIVGEKVSHLPFLPRKRIQPDREYTVTNTAKPPPILRGCDVGTTTYRLHQVERWQLKTTNMDVVHNVLLQVQNATKASGKLQPRLLLTSLRLQPSLNRAIVQLNSVGNLEEEQISQAVEARRFFNDDWSHFELVVTSFILLANQLDPWSLLESFDLYSRYLNDLSIAFTNKSKGHLLAPLLEDLIEYIIPLAAQLDFQLLLVEKHRKPRLTYVASVLLRIFNSIRSLLGGGDHIEAVKKSIMLFIGTRLCLVYFRLSNPLLCRNVFSNMNNANLQFHSYPMNQQLQYRYYLAKFYMVKYQFVDAYQHFSWCLQHCPPNHMRDNVNVSKLLRDLIPVAMILGKKPNIQSFKSCFYSAPAQCPPFLDLYQRIQITINRGSFYQFHELTNTPENYGFLKRNFILLFLSTKACVVILRNLVKKVWIAQGKQARLDYDAIKVALRLSLNGLTLDEVPAQSLGIMKPEQSLDDFVVENCLITLIDQNLLKGKLFPRLRVVSLSKTGAFPSVDMINFIKFGNGTEGNLNHADKWMA